MKPHISKSSRAAAQILPGNTPSIGDVLLEASVSFALIHGIALLCVAVSVAFASIDAPGIP